MISNFQIGHALGLKDSPIKGSVMYSRYSNPLPLELQEDDINRIQHLYGPCTQFCKQKPFEFIGLTKVHTTTTSIKPVTTDHTHVTSVSPLATTKITTPTTIQTATFQTTAATSTVKYPSRSITIEQAKSTFGITSITSSTTATTETIASTPKIATEAAIKKTAESQSLPIFNKMKREQLKDETDKGAQMVLITLETIDNNAKGLGEGLDSIILKRKHIIGLENILKNSSSSQMVVCIFSKCQF